MNNPIALLPMYDWPEVHDATNEYWNTLREALAEQGFTPPEYLSRPDDPFPLWRSPQLLIAQTCGLPFVDHLSADVSLIGTPAYDIDCGAGSYYSVIVVHNDSGIETCADLDGAVFAYNDPLSQSGAAAFFSHFHASGIPLNKIARFERVMSHRNAIQQLSERKVDVAAIDAVTWELAMRHERATGCLRIIGQTLPTPGLPYITTRRPKAEVDRIHRAVVEAIASLPGSIRNDLLLTGFAATTPADYQFIKNRYDMVRSTMNACLT
ncbi:PhnD/SsuA/transferrin family substrate-binding protein [uncultured Sneathiella sp.]|uniref:phosphate/phosphite/phosphonate ABC transporter substrate-binding protein n=1 Tax=uncultured Sneathiella sp. TaxID=879315 RepID=UPI0030EF4D6F|tara:strand:- start:34051 stop:34848 length:798 start_codon:yes stop_codon:yes gene_type:complete